MNAMKALVFTAALALLAGCSGMGGYGSGDMGNRGAAGSDSEYQQQRDDIFNSWIS